MILLPVFHQRQQQQADCLVSCALMVLTYLEIPTSYQYVASVLRTTPFGTLFSNITNLRSVGHFTLVGQGTSEQLMSHIESGLPCIIAVSAHELEYWRKNETNQPINNHAVIVVGFDQDSFYLNDPTFALAPQRVSAGELDLAWLEKDNLYAVIGLDQIEEP